MFAPDPNLRRRGFGTNLAGQDRRQSPSHRLYAGWTTFPQGAPSLPGQAASRLSYIFSIWSIGQALRHGGLNSPFGIRIRARSAKSFERGFTLFEVAIVSALLLIAGTIIVSVLIPSFRSTAAIQDRVSLQQKALVVFRRMASDIQDTTPIALSVSADPPVIAGQPLDRLSAEGRQLFQERLWLYYKEGSELKRLDWRSPGPPSIESQLKTSNPTRVLQEDLENLALGNVPGALVLTPDVTSLTITHAGAGAGVAGPVVIDLVLETRGADPARVQMRRAFSPRLGE